MANAEQLLQDSKTFFIFLEQINHKFSRETITSVKKHSCNMPAHC